MSSVDTIDAQLAERQDAVHALEWAADRSVRYHEMRQSFYDRIDRSIKLLTLVFGSAAVAALLKDSALNPKIPLYSSAIVAGLGLINLTLRTSEMATKHAQLKQKFISLLIALKKVEPTSAGFDQELKALKIERLTIEKDEPPKYCYVDIKAHNEVCRAKDYANCWHLSWQKRVFANFVRGTPHTAVTVAEYQARPKSPIQRLFARLIDGPKTPDNH